MKERATYKYVILKNLTLLFQQEEHKFYKDFNGIDIPSKPNF